MEANVSEKHTVSILSSKDFRLKDGTRMFLRNAGIYLRVYTKSEPGRATLSALLLV
jgi:hypothetical protein